MRENKVLKKLKLPTRIKNNIFMQFFIIFFTLKKQLRNRSSDFNCVF